MPSISGHSVLVIGGSSGIGAAVAKLAAEQGARVSIASSDATRVTNAVTTIKALFPEAHIKGFTINLSTPEVEAHLKALLTTATTESKLDHIILTAGRVSRRSLVDMDREYILEDMHIRLVVPTLLAKLAPCFLKESYISSLTFCGGRPATRPIKGWPAASIAAAALDGLTRALALDLAPVRVNIVHPGPINTELWGTTLVERRANLELITASALLGKVGEPEEVGEAFLYLMRDSNVTGAGVNSSGGSLVQ